jgi:hypothetical protein
MSHIPLLLELTDFAADRGSRTRKTYAGSGFSIRCPWERIVGPDCRLETKTAQVIATKGVTSLFPEKSVSLSLSGYPLDSSNHNR